jgi:hypothetical protein
MLTEEKQLPGEGMRIVQGTEELKFIEKRTMRRNRERQRVLSSET